MSRSLGTLTIDVVAEIGGFVRGMNQSERQTQRWRRQVERNIQSATKIGRRGALALAAGFAAVTAATIAMTSRGLKAVESQQRMARSLDTTYDSVTALQMAFSDGGIDGFEASMNRLNRRLGAAELGRGAALNTVKDLNLNLRELSEMEADQRIAVIADRIKDVATNSQMAARFAQDLGFEQKEAAQFFMQGGSAVEGYREQVDRLGLALDDISAQKVVQANNALGVMGDLSSSLSSHLAAQFAPVLQGIGEELENVVAEMGGMSQVAEAVFTTAARWVGVAADGVDGLYRVFELVRLSAQWFAADATIAMTRITQAVIDGPIAAVNFLIEQFNRIPGLEIGEIVRPGFMTGVDEALAEARTTIATVEQEMHDVINRAHPSERIAQWVADVMAKAHADALAASEQAEDVMSEFEFSDEIVGRYDALNDALSSALERAIKQYSDYYAEIEALQQEGILSEQRATELRLRALENYHEALAEIASEDAGYWGKWLEGAEEALTTFDDMASMVLENFSSQFGDAFESMIFDSESLGDAVGNMAVNMARSVINALGQMAAQWLAYQAVQMISGKTAQASAAGTMLANAQATSLQAGLAAFASTSAIPIVGPSLAPEAMALALSTTQPMVAAISGAALAGMAHDGIDSIPQTGTWLLEKGERVTTADTSAKLDRTLDQIKAGNSGGNVTIQQHFEVNGDVSPQTIELMREATRQGAQQGYRMVLDDFNSNGPARRRLRA